MSYSKNYICKFMQVSWWHHKLFHFHLSFWIWKKFSYRKNQFLTPELLWLLCNAIIQPHFDYACSACYPNLTQKLKMKLQVMQNKCIRFCRQLGKISTIFHKQFKNLTWLSVITRFEQCVISIVFKFTNGNYLYYLN